MKTGYNSKQIMFGLMFGFLVMTGTYNAIVINSESSIVGADVRFAKRLDEVYGVVDSKREFASSMNWQKLSVKQAAIQKSVNPYPQQKEVQQIQAQSSSSESAPVETVVQAAVQDDLSLNLTQVINPKKWQQGLNNSQFSGNLSTNNGVIESLSVSLPNGEGLSVSFSEMTGNVFEYDYEGELYSGMMYQESQNTYVVTLTNGPLEGTRLSFTGEASLEEQMQQEDSQRMLAESNDAEAGMQPAPGTETIAEQTQELPPPQEMVPADNMQYENAYNQDPAMMDQQFQDQGQSHNFEEPPQAM